MDYAVTITFTAHTDTDEHLQNEQAIVSEITSWLEGLNAIVHTVDVRGQNTERTP